jgi:aspartyl-tRNA(Asn)/glutamyl-tRNA(Gln) amidotransferase subunit A
MDISSKRGEKRKMRDFEYFVKSKSVRKVSRDFPLAESLFKEMESRIDRAFKMNLEEFSKEIFENIYDALRGFCDALLALEGYKSYSHEASISFLLKRGFDIAFVKELDNFRIKRNNSKYYAEPINEEDIKAIRSFYQENKEKIYNAWYDCKKEQKMDGERMKFAEKVKVHLEKIKKENPRLNAFLHLNEKAIEEAKEIDEKVAKTGKKGKLYGYVIGVKSNINVSGMITNCASKVLENYKAPYDATVIEKIKAEDGITIGMTNCDEFAAGGSGENSAFGPTQNPSALGRIPGGSSSGSAAAVAAGFCDLALGSDTGGSIRNPASHCGIVGVKPSYGLVSRYGLIDLSMSLDQIGPLAKNVEDATLLLNVIKGKDERDTGSVDSKEIKLEDMQRIKVGVLRIKGVDKRIQNLVDNRVSELKKKFNWEIVDIKIKHIDLAVQTYYLLVYAEFFSATRRFDGRRYGYKIEDKCGQEVLRRILGGSEITKAEFAGKYYRKALEVREVIKEEFERAFKKVDCLILPTVPFLPWRIGEGLQMKPEEVYAADALTIPANLAGICAISIPAGTIQEGKEEIPVGMQVMCNAFEESKMLSIAKKIEEL